MNMKFHYLDQDERSLKIYMLKSVNPELQRIFYILLYSLYRFGLKKIINVNRRNRK